MELPVSFHLSFITSTVAWIAKEMFSCPIPRVAVFNYLACGYLSGQVDVQTTSEINLICISFTSFFQCLWNILQTTDILQKKLQKHLSRKTQIFFGYLCFTFFPFSSHFPPFYLLPPFSVWLCFFFPLPYLLFSIPTDIHLFLLASQSKWWKNSSEVILLCWLVSSPIAMSGALLMIWIYFSMQQGDINIMCQALCLKPFGSHHYIWFWKVSSSHYSVLRAEMVQAKGFLFRRDFQQILFVPAVMPAICGI